MLFPTASKQTVIDQFDTFRIHLQQPPLPEEAEASNQDLLDRINELQRDIKESKKRARQLEQANAKLNQIIINHHTKDTRDADRFIASLENAIDKWNTAHQSSRNYTKNGGGSSRHSSKQKDETYEKGSSGRIKTQQSNFSDENCSFIGNACAGLTKIDLKKKVTSRLSSTQLK